MKNNKLLYVLVGALIISNIYLFTLVNKEETPSYKEPTVRNVATNIESNITEVAEETQNKVVSVFTFKGQQQSGSGSGVVYKNEEGVIKIVTNHHVIEGGTNYIIRFADGQEIEADLLGSDVYTDLALLQVKADLEIEPFIIGDSGLSKVGEFVIAIGSPLGVEFENSVTFGIISGKNRIVPVDLNNDGVTDWDMQVLQTDAAINPGNSGGALVNMAGELIGINSLKFSSNQVEGMGFSIPVNEMVPIIKQIEEKGKVDYPIIGISAISISDLNSFQKNRYNIDENLDKGVLIMEATSGGPAEKANLKGGDIITKFNNEEITSFKDFRRLLYTQRIGETVRLEILRDGASLDVDVTLQ